MKPKRSKGPELTEIEDLAKAVGLLKDWARRLNELEEMRQTRRQDKSVHRRGKTA